MRGENFASSTLIFHSSGSPPLARGKPKLLKQYVYSYRITPACAGKTEQQPLNDCIHGDHPRLRGENLRISHVHSLPTGSPPLARGKPTSTTGSILCCRITPACAGKTEEYTGRKTGQKDHPRLRGENTKKSLDLRDPCFLSCHISFNLNSHFLCSFLKSFHIFETISCNHPMLYVSVFLIHNMPLT